MELDKNKLDFAYKYPFSEEARGIVEKIQSNKIELKYLEMSKAQIEKADTGVIDYKQTNIDFAKTDYLLTYLYSRMLLSATKNISLIKRYSIAEAKRSIDALSKSDSKELILIASELGLNLAARFSPVKDNLNNGELAMELVYFLKYAPPSKDFELVNQRLSKGVILLYKNSALKILEQAIRGKIAKGLPIPAKMLPKEVLDYSKNIKISFIEQLPTIKSKRSENWIEKLLNTPIADIRHRTVNLILAPYLVNSKNLSVEQASKIIEDYIEKCRELDPNTKINERYISYQCSYAKKRGLKPLSIEKAKDLLSGVLDIDGLES